MSEIVDIEPRRRSAGRTAAPPAGASIDVVEVSHLLGGRRVLHDVSLSIAPGELVAVAGGSGAGKTTLLQVLAGLRRPAQGTVLHDGVATSGPEATSIVGYVPQDDIVHRELPLAGSLRYAARLRLPAGATAADVDRVVEATLRDLDLADRADVRVGALSAGLLGVLRALDRLPAASGEVYATLFVTLLVESLAALALGLLASAAVADASQATLALPMLCFPQVLFAGAVVPVGDMSAPGRATSALMANRWGFEALGRALDLEPMTRQVATMGAYRDAFSGSPVAAWGVLAASAVALCGATVLVLHHRCRRGASAGWR